MDILLEILRMRSKRHLHTLSFRGHVGFTFVVYRLESNGDRKKFVFYSLFDFATQSYFSLQIVVRE